MNTMFPNKFIQYCPCDNSKLKFLPLPFQTWKSQLYHAEVSDKDVIPTFYLYQFFSLKGAFKGIYYTKGVTISNI